MIDLPQQNCALKPPVRWPFCVRRARSAASHALSRALHKPQFGAQSSASHRLQLQRHANNTQNPPLLVPLGLLSISISNSHPPQGNNIPPRTRPPLAPRGLQSLDQPHGQQADPDCHSNVIARHQSVCRPSTNQRPSFQGGGNQNPPSSKWPARAPLARGSCAPTTMGPACRLSAASEPPVLHLL